MGIPFYFGEIISRSIAAKKFNLIYDRLPSKCSRFFLDFNSIIHPCSAKVMANLTKSTDVSQELYDKVFASITDYTIELIDIVSPSDVLYIAIDGVAPRAKMNQQRKRRYMSAYRNELINDFKRKHNIPVSGWDSNCITPGTNFMCSLDAYMNTTFTNIVQQKHPNIKRIIISGSNQEGEGEHKMIHYIKQHPSDSTDVIYGLDADLIMLSLSVDAPNIVLMRESTDFGSMHSKSSNVPFRYLVIKNLAESIIHTMQNAAGLKESSTKLLYDYVFICFLLGNDFIPSCSFLKIKEGAVDTLLECYKLARQTLNKDQYQHIIEYTNDGEQENKDRYSINTELLLKLFEQLVLREDKMMDNVHQHYMTALPKPQRNFNTILHNMRQQFPHMTLREMQDRAIRDYSFDIEEYPLRNKAKYDIAPLHDKKWRNSYYHYVFGSNSIELVRNLCENYVDGLLWTVNYYFDKSASTEWYYMYNYAPAASDIYKYLMSNESCIVNRKLNLTHGKGDHEVDYKKKALLQLLLVLPPQSCNLLPAYARPLMTDIDYGCVHEYPQKFTLLTYLKTKMWECCPNIPNINKSNIVKQLEKCKEVSS